MPFSGAHAAVSDDLQFAAALYNDGRYQEALDEFTRLQPSLAGGEWEDDVLFWMSECLFYLQEYDRALEIHRKLMSDHPQFPKMEEVYVKALGANYSAGRYDRVMEMSELFTRKYPAASANDQVYLFWIQSGLRLKQFTRVEELLETYQKAKPGSPYLMSLKSILARYYLEDRKLDKALPYFEELYNYQKDANLLLWVGECRFQTGAYAGAREAFSKFLQEHPDNEVARFKLGLSEYRQGNFPQALEAFRPLAAKEGEFMKDALYFSAQSLLRTGNVDEARQNLSDLLKLSPNEELHSRAVAQLIALEAEGKDIDGMIRMYEKYSNDPSKQEEIRQYKVFSAYQKQDFRAVVSLIDRPKDRREQLMLAESLYALGKHAEAARLYRELLSSTNVAAEKRTAHAGLAWTAYAQEDYDQALKSFQAYLALAPASIPSEVHLAMAQCALAQGSTDQAASFYERARKGAGDPDKITRNLGILYFNSGDYRRAVETLQGFDDDQILSILGRAYLYLKQPAKALPYFRKLKRPERYALEIGAIHYEMGQLEEAKTYFEQAATSPGMTAGVNVDEFLGIISYNQGNYMDAAARLRKAQLKDPGNLEIRFELAAALMRVENAPELELNQILTDLVSNPATPSRLRATARMWLARKSAGSDLGRAMGEINRMESESDRQATLDAMASHFFSQQAYDTAANLYQRLLSSQTMSQESRLQALYGLGWSLYKLGRKAEAKRVFNDLVSTFPKSSYTADVVLLQVEDAQAESRHADAAELALRHMDKVPKNRERLKFMAAESLFELKRYKESMDLYQAFLPQADNFTDYVHYRIGLTAYYLRQFQRSVDHFSLITDSSLVERKHYYLGMCLYELGKKKDATEHFEKLLLKFPHGEFNQEAWNNLVVLMEAVGQWRKILSYESRMLESASELERLVYGKALYHTNDKNAGRYLEKQGYLAKDPEIAAEALYHSALFYKTSDPKKYKLLLEKIILKHPKSRVAPEAQKELNKLQ